MDRGRTIKAIISIVLGLSISHKFKQNQTQNVDSVHFSQKPSISVDRWVSQKLWEKWYKIGISYTRKDEGKEG